MLHVQQVFVSSAELSLGDVGAVAEAGSAEWQEFVHHVEGALELVRDLVTVALEQPGGLKGIAAGMEERGFTREEVVRLVADLLVAAADTTSLTAAWTLHILASHPEIQVSRASSTAFQGVSSRTG